MNEMDEALTDEMMLAADASPYRPAQPGSPLAKARAEAHAAFDPLWKSGEMSRSAAYRWLAKQLGIPKHDCHMLMFDEAECSRVVQVCTARDFEALA